MAGRRIELKDVVAIIPARAGSKGLKDKNVIDLCGKPLMAYSIEAALKTELFSRVIVSTDSERYADIARRYGAEVMMREQELASDTATTYMVVENILGKLGAVDYFVLLQSTSPLRNEMHIREAIYLFEKNADRFDFLASVKEAEHAAVLVKPIEEDLSLKHFDSDFSNYRRQGFKDYSPNGAIFIAKPDAYLKQKHFFGARSIGYIMDKYSSADIDDQIDYELAKVLMTRGRDE